MQFGAGLGVECPSPVSGPVVSLFPLSGPDSLAAAKCRAYHIGNGRPPGVYQFSFA